MMARLGNAARCALGLLVLSTVTASAEPVAIVGGTVHPVAGPEIASGTVLFEDGVIVAVGPVGAVEVPPAAVVVDATGKHVWPSMIDMNTSLGLTEISSVRGTLDTDEIGSMNPNARAEVSLNASSSHLPVTRANGVLLAATLPRGGVVPGTAALIALDGWSWEELVRKAPLGLVIEWPKMAPRKGAASAGANEETADKPLAWEVAIARLDEMMHEASAYARADAARRLLDRVDGQINGFLDAQPVEYLEANLSLSVTVVGGVGPILVFDHVDHLVGDPVEIFQRHVLDKRHPGCAPPHMLVVEQLDYGFVEELLVQIQGVGVRPKNGLQSGTEGTVQIAVCIIGFVGDQDSQQLRTMFSSARHFGNRLQREFANPQVVLVVPDNRHELTACSGNLQVLYRMTGADSLLATARGQQSLHFVCHVCILYGQKLRRLKARPGQRAAEQRKQ